MKHVAISLILLATGMMMPALCSGQEASTAARAPRLIVTTDFPPLDVIPGGAGYGPAEKRSDPDDIQSMVRLLLYTNDLEIEALIASSGTHANVANKQNIFDLLALYDEVDENLRQHDIRYPTADRLRAVTWQGRSGTWGKPAGEVIGEGRDTEASEAIIRIVDLPDPRPVWVGVWGGPADVAQAIWRVRQSRSAEELSRFLGKLRIFMIGLGDTTGQDGSGQWLLDTFPDLFVIASQKTYGGMFAQGTPLGSLEWLDANIRKGRGPLGAAYPRSGYYPDPPGMQEGDTPSFLHLVSAVRGLNDADKPDQEGWGGQYVRRDPAKRHWYDGPGPDSVRKWLPDIQADFAKRAEWMVPAAASLLSGPIRISADGATFEQDDGAPFFWLADTGWLITQKLNREEIRTYLEDRRAKGFNVVQCCVLQFPNDKGANGAPALIDQDITRPATTPGSDPADPTQYDYWDHVDYTIETAAQNGIHLAIAPVWSHMVRRTPLTAEQVGPYITWLAERYKDRPNVIWLNGGSARGPQNADIWQLIGATLERVAPEQLVGFHAFGRTQSSEWFHQASWLDFNTFTSGHRRYDQDTEGRQIGEDNWRYVLEDVTKSPRKPTLDAEPAYENTPQGLHDATQPYWTAGDARRYAYWSVFAGAAGHTYGENSVRQVYIPAETKPASGAKGFIMERLDTDGARAMSHLKALMLSRPYVGRVADQSLLVGGEGEKYDRVLVTRGDGYLLAYTYTGRDFALKLGVLSGPTLDYSWFNPRTGEVLATGIQPNAGTATFNPPGDPSPGNDWVLVLDDAAKMFNPPGSVLPIP